MSSQDAAARVAVSLHRRVRLGLRVPANWLQLGRFAAVGSSGVVVNLAVFAAAHGAAGLGTAAAAVAAWLVAVTNNFAWNRHWTFQARQGRVGFQGGRFLLVSAMALVVQLSALELLVAAGAAALAAQTLAIAIATPVNFLGTKLWSFGP